MAKDKKPEGKMDMQAMMGVYQKLATPGAPHKMLGNWRELGSPRAKAGWNRQAPHGNHGHLRTENDP